MVANSVICMDEPGGAYKVRYMLSCNKRFETSRVELIVVHTDAWKVTLEKKGEKWLVNGKEDPDLADCIDADIVLTPLTNTLPVRRLNLKAGESAIITVAYFNVPERTLTAQKQRYTRLHDDSWHYENVPNDFEANITLDEDGFVVHYPGLFERVLPPVSL